MENMVESFRRKRPKLQARTRRLAGRRTLTGTRRGEETGTRASGRWPGSLPKAARRAKRDLGKVEIDCQRQLHRRSRLGNLRINRAGASEATHKDISRGGSRSMAGVRVFWVFGHANDGRFPRMGNRKGISPEARRGEWKAVHSAREWGEFTRRLGGLTSVSAQISGADAPLRKKTFSHEVTGHTEKSPAGTQWR
jgi:hypothetical protein